MQNHTNKNQLSEFKLAEEYIPQFVCLLIEKNVLQKYSLKKDVARFIFYEEFKPKYNVKRFSFSTMCSYLRFFRLAKLIKDTNCLVFKAEFMDHINIDYNSKNKVPNVVPSTKMHQKVKRAEEVVAIEPLNVTKSPPKPVKTSNEYECQVCNTIFMKKQSLVAHEASESHKLRLNYIMYKKKMVNALAGFVIEIKENHGGDFEDIKLRTMESKVITLSIFNNSDSNLKIVNIMEVDKSRNKYVKLPKISLPLEIPKSNRQSFNISACFSEVIFYIYAVVFTVEDCSTGKQADVLKEIMFHVHSELVDDLHSTGKYKRVSNSVQVDSEIIIYSHQFNSNTLTFTRKVDLQVYDIPNSIIILLNNKLKEFRGINSQEKNMLQDIKHQMSIYKENNTLTQQNYFKLCQLLLMMEEYQLKIDIRNYDVDNQELHSVPGFPKTSLELIVPGLAEKRPSLLCGDSVYIKEQKNSTIKYEGIVQKINLRSVVLGFSNRFINNVHVNKKKYYVSFSFNRFTLRVQHQALELARSHNIIPILCSNKSKIIEERDSAITWFNKNIKNNQEQQQAVKHILSETTRSVPYLIFGPPGTGKTVTIVESVLQIWYTMPKQIMLVCAPSNCAADEITKRLVKHVSRRDLLRYIAPSYCYDFIEPQIRSYINFKETFYYPSLEQLLTYRIIVTTLITAARLVNTGVPPNHFSYVFIDESGQATEPETLVPIAGILSSSKKPSAINGQIVLAGDPRQLGPVILSEYAREYGFDISMLERLLENNNIYKKNENGEYNKCVLTKLVKNYRSHKSILHIPNKLFYDNQLIQSGDKMMINSALGWEELPNKDFPIIFHSVIGKEQRDSNSPSFFNLHEMDIVISYLEKLIGNRLSGMKINQEHIGIITPYAKQVQKLTKLCEKKGWTELRIGSVEQYQGQEKLIVIISTVRSNPEFVAHDMKFRLGFLQNPKRFNVAITRARSLLIVIGNPDLLLHDECWKAFIMYCKENNSIKGTPFEEPTVTVEF